jgi:Phosphotransferase enzyme family
MRRTLTLLLKQCDSKQQAAQERTATDYARTIGGRIQAPRVHRQFGRVLVLEYVAGPSLEQEPSEDRVRAALELLSSLHATTFGHGDYQARNILWHYELGIVPIDWLDSGVCDPRYEWAHFLNSFDGRFGCQAVEGLLGLANEVLCPNVDRKAFARALRVGEIMDRIIRAGSRARTAEDGGDNTDRAAKLRVHTQRLAAIL